MKENLSIGFKSLNDGVTLVEKLKSKVKELKPLDQDALLTDIKKIKAHVQLGERSLYLVLQSGALVWKEEGARADADPSVREVKFEGDCLSKSS